MAKKEKKDKFKITSEDTRKMRRKVRRDNDLERGTFTRTGAHKTAKIDQEDFGKMSPLELAELLEEEQANGVEEDEL